MNIAESLGLVEVYYAEGGEMYEWNDFVVYVDPEPGGKWYWSYGSGCSCNSLFDDYDGTREWFIVGNRDDVLRSAREWNAQSYPDDGKQIRESLMTAIRDWRPGNG